MTIAALDLLVCIGPALVALAILRRDLIARRRVMRRLGLRPKL